MKWKRLLSLRQWSHVFRRTPRFITSSKIPLGEKLLFAVPVLLYWVLPDVMPFMPIDDIGVTRAERKYPDVLEKQHVRVR
jgi:hypothetical protein